MLVLYPETDMITGDGSVGDLVGKKGVAIGLSAWGRLEVRWGCIHVITHKQSTSDQQTGTAYRLAHSRATTRS